MEQLGLNARFPFGCLFAADGPSQEVFEEALLEENCGRPLGIVYIIADSTANESQNEGMALTMTITGRQDRLDNPGFQCIPHDRTISDHVRCLVLFYCSQVSCSYSLLG